MQFWDAYYLEKIQVMKARRKAELEEAGKLRSPGLPRLGERRAGPCRHAVSRSP
jgi:hypothetical protein